MRRMGGVAGRVSGVVGAAVLTVHAVGATGGGAGAALVLQAG